MKVIKFHAVTGTTGYAVEKVNKHYCVVFVERAVVDGAEKFTKLGNSRSRGEELVFSSPFVADYCIRREILPLYGRSA